MEQELHPCFLRSPLLKKGKSVRLPTQVLTGGCRTGGATGDSQSAHFQYKAPLQALAFDVGWQHLQKDKKGSVVLPGTRVKFTGGERKKKEKWHKLLNFLNCTCKTKHSLGMQSFQVYSN